MIAGKTKSGLLAAVGIMVVLPLLGGCGNGGFAFGDHFYNSTDIESTSNARLAYLNVSDDPKKPPITGYPKAAGTASADIVADGAHASTTQMTYPLPTYLGSQENLPKVYDSPELYGSSDSSIMVLRQAGLNEENDTFLTYHERNKDDRTTYARGYVGTRTDAGIITDLRKSAMPRKATYAGTGFVNVGQGDHAYEIDGDLDLKADFGAPDGHFALSGSIIDPSITSPTTDNPDAVNQVQFSGDLLDDSADYKIYGIELRGPGEKIVAAVNDGGGIGSFFGSHAQGTMGAFSGTGATLAGTKAGANGARVNVIGSFAGKAATP